MILIGQQQTLRMKDEAKLGIYVKQYAIRLANFVGRSALGKWFLHVIDAAEGERETFQRELLLSQLQSCGTGFRINGKLAISSPQYVTIGNNVHIGDNAFFRSEGGITIGDNTHISRNVTIYTTNHRYHGEVLPYDDFEFCEPVFIGKNVWIGMNVSIVRGVSIGDGAIIGMGTVVTRDVPPLAVVGNPPMRVIKERDHEAYKKLETARRYGGMNGSPLSDEQLNSFRRSAKDLGNQAFFVVTTGRSGSMTMADLLSQHPQVSCLHEPRPQLVRLSTEFAHGEKDANQVRQELSAIYHNSSVFPENLYGESDQKLWNLIPFLDELFPECKFVWLIRDGKDVVASTYARGWFSDADQETGRPSGSVVSRFAYYRLNGAKCDPALAADEWDAMSVFERNCWYWSFINRQIENSLARLDRNRWIMIRLETLTATVNDLWDFLGVPFHTCYDSEKQYSSACAAPLESCFALAGVE